MRRTAATEGWLRAAARSSSLDPDLVGGEGDIFVGGGRNRGESGGMGLWFLVVGGGYSRGWAGWARWVGPVGWPAGPRPSEGGAFNFFCFLLFLLFFPFLFYLF